MKGIILAKNEFTSKKNVDWVTFDILLLDKENFGRKEYSIVKYWVDKKNVNAYKDLLVSEFVIAKDKQVDVYFDDSKRIVSVR